MTRGLVLSAPRRIALFLVQSLVEVLWVIDKLTGLNLKYISKTFLRLILISIPISILVLMSHFRQTNYLHEIVTESLVPEYVPSIIPSPVITKPKPETTYPKLMGADPIPEITANSAIVMEKNKGVFLYAKNPEIELPPASTVKLMTALVTLDLYDMEDTLSVPEYCTLVEGTKAYLPSGGEFMVRDLLYSMLVGSAGDAACVISNGKISEDEFVSLMNNKAVGIGLNSTVFSNPIGLDNINGGNYSTVSDLYSLAVYATLAPEIRDAVSRKEYIFNSVDGEYENHLYNTNRFLWEVPNTVGIKTGTTEGAGEVLIYEYDDEIKDIVIVVMGSTDRFSDTMKILNWSLANYSWE